MTDDKYATDEWIAGLDPKLTGQIGRPPTDEEIAKWRRLSEYRKDDLVIWKMRYSRSGLRSHMLKYLELRQQCGFIEGVPVPKWLMYAGSG